MIEHNWLPTQVLSVLDQCWFKFIDQGPRIFSYASKSLSDLEKRYAQTEKEAKILQVIYRPGKSNIADFLSRLAAMKAQVNSFNEQAEYYVFFFINSTL